MRTQRAARKSEKGINNSACSTWIDHEVEGCNFKDMRLTKRFGKLLEMMSEAIGESVPYACQDWANTKAAYRFFSNGDVSKDQIMAGHFQATRGRLSQVNQKILMLHDTCEFSFSAGQEFQDWSPGTALLWQQKGRTHQVHHGARHSHAQQPGNYA